jgi:hypothetical protein
MPDHAGSLGHRVRQTDRPECIHFMVGMHGKKSGATNGTLLAFADWVKINDHLVMPVEQISCPRSSRLS